MLLVLLLLGQQLCDTLYCLRRLWARMYIRYSLSIVCMYCNDVPTYTVTAVTGTSCSRSAGRLARGFQVKIFPCDSHSHPHLSTSPLSSLVSLISPEVALFLLHVVNSKRCYSTVMLRSLVFFILLIITSSTSDAEKLSSGEDVSSFVVRHIQDYQVSIFFCCRVHVLCSLCFNDE
jgi:hypothetical protein